MKGDFLAKRDSVSVYDPSNYLALYDLKIDSKRLAEPASLSSVEFAKKDSQESLKQEALEKLRHISKYRIVQSGFMRVGKYLCVAAALPLYLVVYKLPLWLVRTFTSQIYSALFVGFKSLWSRGKEKCSIMAQQLKKGTFYFYSCYQRLFLEPFMRLKAEIAKWLSFQKQYPLEFLKAIWNKRLGLRINKPKLSLIKQKTKLSFQQALWRWKSRAQRAKQFFLHPASLMKRFRSAVSYTLPIQCARAWNAIKKKIQIQPFFSQSGAKCELLWQEGFARADRIAAALLLPLAAWARPIQKISARFTSKLLFIYPRLRSIQKTIKGLSAVLAEGGRKWMQFWMHIHTAIQTISYERLYGFLFSARSPFHYLPEVVKKKISQFLAHPYVKQMLCFFGWLLRKLFNFLYGACGMLGEGLSLIFKQFKTIGAHVRSIFRKRVSIHVSGKKGQSRFSLLFWLQSGLHFFLVSFIMSFILIEWGIAALDRSAFSLKGFLWPNRA